MSSPGDDDAAYRLKARLAAARDQMELALAAAIQDAVRRYHTEAEFRHRVDAVAEGVAAITASYDPTLARVPVAKIRNSITEEVMVYLAADDFVVGMWIETTGYDVRRGPGTTGEAT